MSKNIEAVRNGLANMVASPEAWSTAFLDGIRELLVLYERTQSVVGKAEAALHEAIQAEAANAIPGVWADFNAIGRVWQAAMDYLAVCREQALAAEKPE